MPQDDGSDGGANLTERLAVLVHDLRGGGAERVMLNLAAGLADRGHDVDLVLVRAEGPYLSQVPKNVRVVNLDCPRVLLSIPSLVRYMRREQPSGLIAALVNLNLAAIIARWWAKTPTTVVITEHFVTEKYIADTRVARLRMAYRLAPLLYGRADAIVAVSQSVAENLATYTGLPLETITVVNNPVVTRQLSDMAREPVTHPWLMPGQPPVIMGVGRLSSEKDFPTLIKAFSIARSRQPMRLIIIGEGPQKENLSSLVDSLGLTADIDLPGFAANPYALISRAAVLAMSSKNEGSPNALVEALACGTQVVSTDCPGGPSETLACGRYGRLVPVGEPEMMAQALLEALDSPIPITDLTRRAQDYTAEKSAEKYLEVLRASLPPHRSRATADAKP